MHLIPQLRKAEEKFSQELVVVGVHSAKFPSERLTENLRQATLRYGIRHPVVNDAAFQMWHDYGVRAWPTLMFIDPQGKVIGKHEGEIRYEALERTVSDIIAEFDQQGLMSRAGMKLRPEQEEKQALAFPGKLLADEASQRLFIADSGYHRVIVAMLKGQVQAVIGSGQPGLQDGSVATARFTNPQGLALEGNLLFVADTGNHAIRQVDLAKGTVATVAGTGQQARRFSGEEVLATQTPLSSPWDLTFHQGVLYIAMAGFHQLWELDLQTGHVLPFAGNGREGRMDGPMQFAMLAQPSGICSDGQQLYFVDSETSSVRSADPHPYGNVKTIVGLGLFDFGDVDGAGETVRLQHPIGICWHDGVLYVADTYNNKVKRIDPRARRSEMLLGSGEPGFQDGEAQQAQFHEPSGLSVAGTRLYIADTNNHAIRIADLRTSSVGTLELRGI